MLPNLGALSLRAPPAPTGEFMALDKKDDTKTYNAFPAKEDEVLPKGREHDAAGATFRLRLGRGADSEYAWYEAQDLARYVHEALWMGTWPHELKTIVKMLPSDVQQLLNCPMLPWDEYRPTLRFFPGTTEYEKGLMRERVKEAYADLMLALQPYAVRPGDETPADKSGPVTANILRLVGRIKDATLGYAWASLESRNEAVDDTSGGPGPGGSQEGMEDGDLSTEQLNERLEAALETGDGFEMRALLQSGADPNTSTVFTEQTVAHWAAYWNDLETLRSAIAHDCNLSLRNVNGETPLMIASQRGNAGIVEEMALSALPTLGLNLEDSNGMTALMVASRNKHQSVVNALLRARADATIQSSTNGYTALHYAAEIASAAIIHELLNYEGAGVDPNAQTFWNEYAPLHLVDEDRYKLAPSEAIDALINGGAEIDRRDGRSRTALHYAAYANKVALATYLLNRRADPNARTRKGTTPLHFAVGLGGKGLELVLLLMRKRADKTVKNKDGHSPVDVAKNYTNDRVRSTVLWALGEEGHAPPTGAWTFTEDGNVASGNGQEARLQRAVETWAAYRRAHPDNVGVREEYQGAVAALRTYREIQS